MDKTYLISNSVFDSYTWYSCGGYEPKLKPPSNNRLAAASNRGTAMMILRNGCFLFPWKPYMPTMELRSSDTTRQGSGEGVRHTDTHSPCVQPSQQEQRSPSCPYWIAYPL